VLVVSAVAVGYDVVRGASPAVSFGLAMVVLVVTLRDHGARRGLGEVATASSVQHLFVAYAAVSLAVVLGALGTRALPQAAVLFGAGGVILAGTAFVR